MPSSPPAGSAFARRARQGANSRGLGEDAAEGEAVLPAGRRLGAAELARLAAVGVDQVAVRAPLRVAVLSTGDELLQPGADPAAPGIFDANRPMLRALVGDFGPRAGRPRRHARPAGGDPRRARPGRRAGRRDPDDRRRLGGRRGPCFAPDPRGGAADDVADRRQAGPAAGNGPVAGRAGLRAARQSGGGLRLRPDLRAARRWPSWPGATGPSPRAFSCRRRSASARSRGGASTCAPGSTRPARPRSSASEGSGLIGGLTWAEGLVELPDGAAEIEPGTPVRYLPYPSFGLRS